MKKLIPLSLVLFVWITTSAQIHDAVWLFGGNSIPPDPDWGHSVLDFNFDPPMAYPQEREMNIDITMTSMCDSIGNLLFYTNGIYIANYTHAMMENGDSLNPGELTWDWVESGLPVFQSAITLPYPGHEGMYFLLHLKLDYDDVYILSINTFYYSLIDMNENNGLGKVLVKNQTLLTEQTLGTITALKHANGRDWWIVVSDVFHFRYKVFLLSPSGLHFFSEQNFGITPQRINGTLSFSPDGTKMAQYEVPLNKVVFYNFDRCSGVLSNQVVVNLPETTLGGGQAFSPDSRFFYMVSSDFVLQADTWATDIAASIDTVAIYDGFIAPNGLSTTFFAMQPGPDGRIYFNTNNGTKYLHYINRPNNAGESCEVVQHGIELPYFNFFTSPHFPNFRLGPLDGSPCDTLGLDNHPLAGFRYEVDTVQPLLVQFIDNSFYEPTDWLWDFGGTGSSTETDPIHAFPAPGTYTVCLTVSNQYDSDTFCREVTLEATGVKESTEDNFASIFPNPASTEIHLTLRQAGNGQVKLFLYDATGRQVQAWGTQPGQQAHTFQLGNLLNGLYFWKVELENGKWRSGKLIVSK